VALIDPAAAQVMELSSQVLAAQDQIARQRKTIWQLVALLRSSQRVQAELAMLLDDVLAGDG